MGSSPPKYLSTSSGTSVRDFHLITKGKGKGRGKEAKGSSECATQHQGTHTHMRRGKKIVGIGGSTVGFDRSIDPIQANAPPERRALPGAARDELERPRLDELA